MIGDKMNIFRSNMRLDICLKFNMMSVLFLKHRNIPYVCVCIYIYVSDKSSTWDPFRIATTMVFRDPPFWPHAINQATQVSKPIWIIEEELFSFCKGSQLLDRVSSSSILQFSMCRSCRSTEKQTGAGPMSRSSTSMRPKKRRLWACHTLAIDRGLG